MDQNTIIEGACDFFSYENLVGRSLCSGMGRINNIEAIRLRLCQAVCHISIRLASWTLLHQEKRSTSAPTVLELRWRHLKKYTINLKCISPTVWSHGTDVLRVKEVLRTRSSEILLKLLEDESQAPFEPSLSTLPLHIFSGIRVCTSLRNVLS